MWPLPFPTLNDRFCLNRKHKASRGQLIIRSWSRSSLCEIAIENMVTLHTAPVCAHPSRSPKSHLRSCDRPPVIRFSMPPISSCSFFHELGSMTVSPSIDSEAMLITSVGNLYPRCRLRHGVSSLGVSMRPFLSSAALYLGTSPLLYLGTYLPIEYNVGFA